MVKENKGGMEYIKLDPYTYIIKMFRYMLAISAIMHTTAVCMLGVSHKNCVHQSCRNAENIFIVIADIKTDNLISGDFIFTLYYIYGTVSTKIKIEVEDSICDIYVGVTVRKFIGEDRKLEL